MAEEQLWHQGIDFWEGQQPVSGGMAGSDILQAAWLWPFSPPVQAVQALGTQLLGGCHHGYWEEEAICGTGAEPVGRLQVLDIRWVLAGDVDGGGWRGWLMKPRLTGGLCV